jgi:hypothetical protein
MTDVISRDPTINMIDERLCFRQGSDGQRMEVAIPALGPIYDGIAGQAGYSLACLDNVYRQLVRLDTTLLHHQSSSFREVEPDAK